MDLMNYEEACVFLELDKDIELDDRIIKKQYRMLALKYHPDKNKTVDSNEKFYNIKNAYEYLMEYEGYFDNDDIDDGDKFSYEETNDTSTEQSTYTHLLFSFVNTIVSEDNSNILIKSILNKISNMCQEKAVDTLNKLDKTTLLKVYELLLKYRDAFHFDFIFMEKIKEIIVTKSNNDERIILNPSLDDLFEQKLYKLVHNDIAYYVPLWHNEVIYDISGCKLYVSCEPELPENSSIDDRNNIHVTTNYVVGDIWNKGTVDVIIGPKKIPICVDSLLLKSSQTIKYANMGIPMAKSNDVYDVSRLCDIIVHINLSFV